MRIRAFATIGLLLVSGCASQEAPKKGAVTSYEAPGNLESTHALGCIPGSSVTAQYTPADLYPAFAKCVMADRFAEATDLYAFAFAFAVYDTKRVPDKTAHQAIMVLQLENMSALPDEKKRAFGEYFERVSVPGSPSATAICDELRRVGPPQYEPRYMIQHGMGAASGQPSAPPSDFDSAATWSAVLKEQIRCG